MNVNKKINVLLLALNQKGQCIRLSRLQKYSEEKKRLVTAYIIQAPGKKECFGSGIEVMQFLAARYKELTNERSEADN